MSFLVINNAHIVTPLGNAALHGADMGRLHECRDAVIVVNDGTIVYAGRAIDIAPFLVEGQPYKAIDAKGRVVLPGFVDSHTHLIFGGYRPDEFEMRLRGASYMEIMNAGGGIQATVDATRSESVDILADKARKYLRRMAQMGVTTVEAKSGYGLDTPSEVKMLRAIERLAKDPERLQNIVATFMGAHAVPSEYKGRTDEYVDLVIDEMLPAVKGLTDICDIFTEKDVFEIDESRRLLKAAAEQGFRLKLHADEIVTLGGAELAVELSALSADHLLHVSDEGIRRLAKSDVVATLLPLTAFSLKDSYAPARKMIDQGCAVALATDLNPGSCFCGSIPLMISLASIYMNMSIEEIITALTLNGAAALGLANRIGSIEVGKQADIVILDADNYRFLNYYIAMSSVATTIFNGNITFNSEN